MPKWCQKRVQKTQTKRYNIAMIGINSPTHCRNTRHHRGWPSRTYGHRGWPWRQQTYTRPHHTNRYEQHPKSIDNINGATLFSRRSKKRYRRGKIRQPMRLLNQQYRHRWHMLETPAPTKMCQHRHCSYRQRYQQFP